VECFLLGGPSFLEISAILARSEREVILDVGQGLTIGPPLDGGSRRLNERARRDVNRGSTEGSGKGWYEMERRCENLNG